MIYNEHPTIDRVLLLTQIDILTESYGVRDVEIDISALDSVVDNYRKNFPHKDGVENSSVFKKVAYFLCHFVSMRPIVNPFPVSVVQDDVVQIDNHQNAMVAFSIASEIIKNSLIRKPDGDIEIAKPIWLSRHSYVDLIEALSSLSPPTHFKCVSVLFEQLTYKSNPNCQYDYEDFEEAMAA